MVLLAVWLLGLLVVARVTRFLVSDALSAPFRDAVQRRLGPDSKLVTQALRYVTQQG